MATLNKTFAFASNADGWTLIAGSWDTVAFNSGDGNPAGSIRFNDTGRNDTASTSITWTGTFEDLGVPAGSTITGYSAAAFDHRCGVWNVVDAASLGPFDINDGTARTLVTAQSFTGTTAWATQSASPGITGLSLASNTSITLSVTAAGDNGNNASAQVELRLDNVSLTVEYTEPLAAIVGTLAATEGGADAFGATGTVADSAISGSLAATEAGADSLAASGKVLVAGALLATEAGADAFAGPGLVVVAGALSASEAGADILAATGSLRVSGEFSAAESGQDVLAASGAVRVSGTLTASEVGQDVFVGVGGGVVVIAGLLAAAEVGADAFAAAGAAVIRGDLVASEVGDDVVQATGQVALSGDFASTESGADGFAAFGFVGEAGAVGQMAAAEVGADQLRAVGNVSGRPEPPRPASGGGYAVPLRFVPYIPVRVRRPRKRRKIEVLFM